MKVKNTEFIEDKIVRGLSESLYNALDNFFIEGLALKGYEFKNKEESIEFIKNNCTSVDNPSKKQKIFYVKGEPFFLYNYDIEIVTKVNTRTANGNIHLSADYGSFSYI